MPTAKDKAPEIVGYAVHGLAADDPDRTLEVAPTPEMAAWLRKLNRWMPRFGQAIRATKDGAAAEAIKDQTQEEEQ